MFQSVNDTNKMFTAVVECWYKLHKINLPYYHFILEEMHGKISSHGYILTSNKLVAPRCNNKAECDSI